jgi:hypothetical protein
LDVTQANRYWKEYKCRHCRHIFIVKTGN